MNNRELLELAALAAGVTGTYRALDSDFEGKFSEGISEHYGYKWWNPLEDDGDALRLAADLRLKIIPGKHKGDGCTVESQQEGVRSHTVFFDNPIKQMRFAVTYVAAEIGKSMKVH